MNCVQRGGALPSPIVGWIHNFAVHNYWRVAGFYELDDLCQDGLLCAVRCRNRYGDITDQHLMTLVKTSFNRYLIDLTRRYRAAGDVVYLADLGVDEVAVLEKYSVAENPLGELVRCIEELPDYLYWVIKCLLTDTSFRASRGDQRDLRYFLCDS